MSALDGISTGTITLLLRKARSGERQAQDKLFECVYDELRRMARGQLRASARGAGDGTALVHAACERMLGKDILSAEDRRHFFFLLGRAMHDVFVEQARAETARKRGGGRQSVPLYEFEADGKRVSLDVLDLREALNELRQTDEQAAQIVSLRFFGGRSLEESAELMGCTFSIARRHWDYARAWLHEKLSRTETASYKKEI